MANQEIIKFIGEQKVAGYTDQQIREALKSKGWADSEIEDAFAEWTKNPTLPDKQVVGRFVGESWVIYKQLFPQFMRVLGKIILKFLIVAIPGIILGAIGAYLDNAGQISQETLKSAGIGLAVIYAIVFTYFAIWTQVSFLHIIRNRNVIQTPDEHIAGSKNIIWPFFLTSVLSGLLTFLWFLLLIIPGIIFGVYYMLAEYIVVDKNISGMNAVRMSKKYIEGLWWPVFTSILGLAAVGIIVYIASSIIGVAFGPAGESVSSILLNIFFTPYSLIYMFLLYERLKVIKPEIQ